MKKYEDCMVDIESLDTTFSTAIPSIGAAAFNLSDHDTEESLRERRRCFYAPLEFQTQLDKGRTVSEKTIRWWMEQDAHARSVFTEPRGTVCNALVGLTRFCKVNGIKRIWGNGNMFDNAAIRSLYKDFGLASSYPVDFRSDMDLRTYRLAAGSPEYEDMGISRIGTHHNALDDARHQVLQAQYYYQLTNHGKTNA